MAYEIPEACTSIGMWELNVERERERERERRHLACTEDNKKHHSQGAPGEHTKFDLRFEERIS